MRKFALLIGVSQTSEEELPELPSAIEDIRAMQAVLQNPELGGFDSANIKVLSNPTRQEMELAIETLFANRKQDDLVLFYFSGHGITDEKGKLYLVTPETQKDRGNLIKATAVAATVLHEHMLDSRSKHQVLILDSCFSGAISEGLTGKSAEYKVDIQRELGGEGRAILTSSNAVQKSFHIQGYDLSIYTHYLIDGIQTGAANQDGDDYISVDELHEYAKKKLEQEAPAMSPQFFPVKEGYKIRLVRSPKPKDDPELEYRQEAEDRLHQGEFSPTATRVLKHKRDQLKLSPERAEAIEAEIKKPWQERRRKLQEYEENLQEELKRHTPLLDRTLSELDDYRKVLGLRPEDVQPIHQKLNVSMAAIDSPPPSQLAEPAKVSSQPSMHQPKQPSALAGVARRQLLKWAIPAGIGVVGVTVVASQFILPPPANSPKEAAADDWPPEVVASYSVICDLASQVAADAVELNCLIPPNQDPHTYEATPSDREAVDTADLVFYAGLNFEPSIIDMATASYSEAPKIALHDESVQELIEVEEEGALEPDPHVWHDVENGLAMVALIRDNLIAVDPDNAEMYTENAAQLTAELETLDTWIPEQIATIPEGQRRLITTQDAMSYYARAYGLVVEGTLLGLSTEGELTAAQVKALSDSIQAIGVPIVFAELTANDKVLQTVANEAGVYIDVLIADGIGEEGTPAGTYQGMLVYNTCTIVTGLGGTCSEFE